MMFTLEGMVLTTISRETGDGLLLCLIISLHSILFQEDYIYFEIQMHMNNPTVLYHLIIINAAKLQ